MNYRTDMDHLIIIVCIGMKANIEVFQNLSELHTLKLIATTMNKNIDYLSPKVRWKVNVPWEIIKEISESVHFNVSDYFSDIHE